MPQARLELKSSYGDQTIARSRFAVHGTSNGTDFAAIMQGGLRFIEGRPTLSTNLVHAHDWTVNPEKQAQSWGGGTVPGSPGRVILCAMPANFHLGYGVFTTAYIDRSLKLVNGAPLRYAAGRKQLALYMSADTEAARVHIEAEIANGFPLDQHPQFILEPQFLIGAFNPSLEVIMQKLDVAVRSFQPLDYDALESGLRDSFETRVPESAAFIPTAMHEMVVATAESILISRLRMMRWQGMALLGYRFNEGQQEVAVASVKDMAEQRRRIDEFGRSLASSSLFSGELAWLKVYAAHELDLMRVELDGAELEALPD